MVFRITNQDRIRESCLHKAALYADFAASRTGSNDSFYTIFSPGFAVSHA